MKKTFIALLLPLVALAAPPKVVKTDAEWKKQLTPAQYEVLRKAATEPAFKGEYTDNHQKGTYFFFFFCYELFKSDTKFDSGCGWPSFFAVAAKDRVVLLNDDSHGMHRVEVRCASCNGHLGHVFEDGPKPTGLRYCINSISLKFKPAPK